MNEFLKKLLIQVVKDFKKMSFMTHNDSLSDEIVNLVSEMSEKGADTPVFLDNQSVSDFLIERLQDIVSKRTEYFVLQLVDIDKLQYSLNEFSKLGYTIFNYNNVVNGGIIYYTAILKRDVSA